MALSLPPHSKSLGWGSEGGVMLERPKDDETRWNERLQRSGGYIILGVTALVALVYSVLHGTRREWVELCERALPFFGAGLGAVLYLVGLEWVYKNREFKPYWLETSAIIVFLVLWFGLVYFFT
jgi:hypothetical protein